MRWNWSAICRRWDGRKPSDNAIGSVGMFAASSNAQSSHSFHFSSKSRSLATWSIVSNEGGRPASRGRSRRIDPAKLCSVVNGVVSMSSTPLAHICRHVGSASSSDAALSSSSLMRSLSSEAAEFVNVIAATLSTVVTPEPIRLTTLPTMLVVLPVPAPASTNMVWFSDSRIRSRAAWSMGVNAVVTSRLAYQVAIACQHRMSSLPAPHLVPSRGAERIEFAEPAVVEA